MKRQVATTHSELPSCHYSRVKWQVVTTHSEVVVVDIPGRLVPLGEKELPEGVVVVAALAYVEDCDAAVDLATALLRPVLHALVLLTRQEISLLLHGIG